jgi:ABC-type protease/lipase transport system fused ATPase/permease subunit
VQLLTFDSLACSVPLRSRLSWVNKARRLLCLGRGQGSPTAEPAPASLAPTATSAADVAAASDPPGHKLILRGVSGVAACGELVGVLGPSGSGKTTLLAVLAGSAEDLDKRSSLHGAVALDGRPLSSAARRQIAYVAQDDTLLPTLTVEECVRYSAILR